MSEKRWLLAAGVLAGLSAVLLTFAGNPANMGFCIACFLRDIAGGLGLHRAAAVQYLRPEIVGLVCGACLMALARREFLPRGGSSPLLRFFLGFGVMVGALVFLGCPLRMVLRLSGGDLNALAGLLGFFAGILAGVAFLKRGFTLGRNYRQKKAEGLAMPLGVLALLPLLLTAPAFLFFSAEGPGSLHAPVLLSLAAGLAVGAAAQRTRLCMAGGIRDVVLFRDATLLSGFLAIFLAALLGNLALGNFHLSLADQPIAHTDGLWNFLGMTAVGLGSTLLGGCPLRQLILTGEGDSDAACAVLGMIAGAAFCHNFGLASSAAGPTLPGMVACTSSLVLMAVIGLCHSAKSA